MPNNAFIRKASQSVNSSRVPSLPSIFHLGPLDQLGSHTSSTAVVYVYESCSPHLLQPIHFDKLVRSLQYLLDSHPHLTGRLRVDNISNRRALHQFGSGVTLVEAECLQTLSSCSAPREGRPQPCLSELPGGGNDLLVPFDSSFQAVCEGPLLSIQHTRFACGSVALGFRILHAVADGAAFFRLCKQLGEVYRSLDKPTGNSGTELHASPKRPYLAGIEGAMTPDEILAARSFVPDNFRIVPDQSKKNTALRLDHDRPPSKVIGKYLYLTAEILKDIKLQARDQSNPETWITTFEALSADIYQAVHRARLRLRVMDTTMPPISQLDFYTVIDLRSRLHPYLDATYPFNARLAVLSKCSPDLFEGGPELLAKQIHHSTRIPSLVKPDTLNKTLKWLAVQPNMANVSTGFAHGSGSLLVSQWNKFDLYSTIFETAPVLASTPFAPSTLLDGLVYFLPAKTEGDVQLCMALTEETWTVLEADTGFRSLIP
jgi:hypothetical protein